MRSRADVVYGRCGVWQMGAGQMGSRADVEQDRCGAGQIQHRAEGLLQRTVFCWGF